VSRRCPTPSRAQYGAHTSSEAGREGARAAGVVFGYHVLKQLPDPRQALDSLEHVGWRWPVSAVALALLSEGATSCRGGLSSTQETCSSVTAGEGGPARGSRELSSEAGCFCPAARLRASAWAPGSSATSPARV